MLASIALLFATVLDPADVARFEPLYRANWERTRTAQAAVDYGLFLRSIGREEGAAEILRKSLDIGETVEALEALGLYERALKLSRTGELLRKAGAQAEARKDLAAAAGYYEQARVTFEKTQGAGHPNVALALIDLGYLLEQREQFKQAESYYRRAVAIQERALGAVHPEIGTALNNLGMVVGAQGRLAEAEPLLRRALAILERTLGPAHERTTACAANLKDLLAAKGAARSR
jgi:tetratricopeptide (TPR) repeat protein